MSLTVIDQCETFSSTTGEPHCVVALATEEGSTNVTIAFMRFAASIAVVMLIMRIVVHPSR